MRFRRPRVRYSDTSQPVTPYQAAAQAWDLRMGSSLAQARNWRLMAFGCLGLALLMAGGLVWLTQFDRMSPAALTVVEWESTLGFPVAAIATLAGIIALALGFQRRPAPAPPPASPARGDLAFPREVARHVDPEAFGEEGPGAIEEGRLQARVAADQGHQIAGVLLHLVPDHRSRGGAHSLRRLQPR